VDTVKILRERELTDEEYFKAGLLGWCIELVSVTFFPTLSLILGATTKSSRLIGFGYGYCVGGDGLVRGGMGSCKLISLWRMI